MMPERAPPTPQQYASAMSHALPVASCCTQARSGTPEPSVNWRRTMWPGPLGAHMMTLTSSGGTM